MLLGPCINMQRSPLFGRHFECFSEDAYLTARITVGYVRGVQRHAAACAKHFVCNDQEEHRHTMNSVIDERTLRELYLAPFEAAVKDADVESIMCGYNRVNGSYCTENTWLLEKVLRSEWGFKGWIVSDWFGNQSTVPSLNAGLNVEMPGIEPRHYGGYLMDAYQRGQIADELLDERCRPVLRTILRRAGQPGPGAPAQPPDAAAAEQRQRVLRRASAASHVLLRNENGTLPLDPAVVRRLAVIGPCAAETVIQGGGSSRVKPRFCTSILDALRASLPRNGIVHTPGCFIGDLPYTHPELEALKPIAGCDNAGQPQGTNLARLFDFGLVLAWNLSSVECLRVYLMPVLRVLGLRQSDPVKVAEQLAKNPPKPVGHASASSSGLYQSLATLGIIAGLAIAVTFSFGLWGSGWPRLRFAVGILSFGTVGVLVALSRRRANRRRLEERWMHEAEVAAREADVCLLVLGSGGFFECEGMDRPNMLLPGRQNELAERVAAVANGPVVVVLNTGSPKELPWLSSVSAVLMVHYGGEETGPAVADTLLGASSPAGRLPFTWPRRLEDAPAVVSALSAEGGRETLPAESTTLLGAPTAKAPKKALPGETVYGEGLRVGYRAFCEGGVMGSITPQFSFGHGLSYTSFEYGQLEVEHKTTCAETDGPRVIVRTSVKNVGKKPGAEVVQLYTEATANSREPAPAPRALRAFTRTSELAPGEEKSISFELDSRALGASYSVDASAWLEPLAGESVCVEVGGSSTDVRGSTNVVLK